MDIKTRRIISGIAIALAAAGMWMVTSLNLGLPSYLTGLLAAVCALAIVGSLMVWFAEEIGADRRP